MAKRREKIRTRDEDKARLDEQSKRAPRSDLYYAQLYYAAHKIRQLLESEREKALGQINTTFYPQDKDVVITTEYARKPKHGYLGLQRQQRTSKRGAPYGRTIRVFARPRKELCALRRERQRRAYFGFLTTGRRRMPHRRKPATRFTKRC